MPAEMLYRQGWTSSAASSAGRKKSSRRAASISAAVGSSVSSIASLCASFVCVTPVLRQVRGDPFRLERGEFAAVVGNRSAAPWLEDNDEPDVDQQKP